MRKHILGVVLAGIMLVASVLSGCGKKSENSGSVYWLNFKPEADQALRIIATSYEKQTGVPVKIVTPAIGEYGTTLTAEMEKADAPTLFIVGNQASLSSWSESCYDLRATDVFSELSTDAFTLYDEEGKACSIGYCYESFGLIVNKVLLKKAGYEVEDITDFDSLKKIADDIHNNAEELGFDAFTSAGLNDNSAWRFTGHLANMPLYYEAKEDDWKCCPETIKGTYLDNYKKIWDLYITDSATNPATLTSKSYDAFSEFVSGDSVFYQNGTWEFANLSRFFSNDELAMIPLYVGVDGEENAGLCSGTENCWAVNSNASEEDIQATLDFMNWLVTSAEGTTMMSEQFGEIPYRRAPKNKNVFFQCAKEYIEQGKYTVDWTFNYTPNVVDWRAELLTALADYSAGGDWSQVEEAFVGGWEKQYKLANGK